MSERRKPRRSAGFTLPRALPWPSFLSRVWPGTLIVCWTALTTFVITIPTWATLGAVASSVDVSAYCPLPVASGAVKIARNLPHTHTVSYFPLSTLARLPHSAVPT